MGSKDDDRAMLTRLETEIMHVLWKRGQATVHEVVADLARPLAYTTVLTMLRLLEQKGYATREPSPDGGRAHVYKARLSERGVRRSHLRDLVDRLFGGETSELAIGLVRDEGLTQKDLEKLRAEIDAVLAAKKATKERRGR